MFVDPLKDYLRLCKKLNREVKKENFVKVLNISLEALSLLPSAYREASSQGGLKPSKFKPLEYACKYLTILQEKKELDCIKRILDNVNVPPPITDKTNPFLQNYDQIDKMINYIKQEKSVPIKDLLQKFELEKDFLQQVLSAAEEINIIKKEKSMIYDQNCDLNLKEFLKNKDKKNDNKGLLQKISNIFK